MKIKVGDEEVFLDPDNLKVNEVNLNDFLKHFPGTYDYYSRMMSTAQYLQSLHEDKYDWAYSKSFDKFKTEQGGSDKLNEYRTNTDEEIVHLKKKVRDSKFIAQLLQNYVRSLDKARESALNLGYNIRKEMDNVFPKHIKGSMFDEQVDKEVAQLFKKIDSND